MREISNVAIRIGDPQLHRSIATMSHPGEARTSKDATWFGRIAGLWYCGCGLGCAGDALIFDRPALAPHSVPLRTALLGPRAAATACSGPKPAESAGRPSTRLVG